MVPSQSSLCQNSKKNLKNIFLAKSHFCFYVLFILWVKVRRRNKEEWWKDKKEKVKSSGRGCRSDFSSSFLQSAREKLLSYIENFSGCYI